MTNLCHEYFVCLQDAICLLSRNKMSGSRKRTERSKQYTVISNVMKKKSKIYDKLIWVTSVLCAYDMPRVNVDGYDDKKVEKYATN